MSTSLAPRIGLRQEAERKRSLALEAADGYLVTSRPEDVRWLLCGRGRPVDVSSPTAGYTVVLEQERARVLYPDIEDSRVRAEERLEDLGYEHAPYSWHRGQGLAETPAVLGLLRMELVEAERERYRHAGADLAAAFRLVLPRLSSELAELDAAAELSAEAQRRGFATPVVLVGGDDRRRVHRHPLPTSAPLGRHALLAITAERDGLYVSMTRLVSFAAPPASLTRLAQACAEVDAAFLAASRPGSTMAEVFDAGAEAYAVNGFRHEWRKHHQGGLTGYRGREVFATPGERTRIPASAALAWNPSITGGVKSEDTVLVSSDGIEVVTRTADLGELETSGLPRPAIVEL